MSHSSIPQQAVKNRSYYGFLHIVPIHSTADKSLSNKTYTKFETLPSLRKSYDLATSATSHLGM
jgi:hypothetical protein